MGFIWNIAHRIRRLFHRAAVPVPAPQVGKSTPTFAEGIDSAAMKLRAFPLQPGDDTAWHRLMAACAPLSPWGLRTLRSGLEATAKSAIIEPFYVCSDHRDLYSNFYSKKLRTGSPFCERIHFFACDVPKAINVSLAPDDFADDYLGYSVIRPVTERCLGRTVIDPWKLGMDVKHGFYLLRAPFSSHVAGATFDVQGYPYMSQDKDVTVCAHTVLWGVCRFLSQRYHHYGEVHPYDLVRLTDTNLGRPCPYRGMSYLDYSRILSEFGTFPELISFGKAPAVGSAEWHDMCSYVESGFPMIASLPGHVVALIGHTLDLSMKPKTNPGGFIESSTFLKQFVVVDDNAFPYRLLGRKGDLANYTLQFSGTQYDCSMIQTAVCPLPEKVFLPGRAARKQADAVICDRSSLITPLVKGDRLVRRMFITTCYSFLQRKVEAARSGDALAFFPANLKLPHFVWVVELSPLDRYLDPSCGRKCLCEFVLDATAGADDDSLIYARIGDQVFFENNKVQPPGALPYFVHFTHNLGEEAL